jgi:hypothetical protein
MAAPSAAPGWQGRSGPRAIRAALGEARFASACAEGRALTLAQAINEARGDLA